jgi:DNA-binding NtrC family response regulator
MREGDNDTVLALVPARMHDYLNELEAATEGTVRRATTIAELISASGEESFAVTLIPATGFASEEWWSIWGCLNTMEPPPSILVYALQSDFEMWSSVLNAGGYDVIVAPFTTAKLRDAIREAVLHFNRQDEDCRPDTRRKL